MRARTRREGVGRNNAPHGVVGCNVRNSTSRYVLIDILINKARGEREDRKDGRVANRMLETGGQESESYL